MTEGLACEQCRLPIPPQADAYVLDGYILCKSCMRAATKEPEE